MDLRGKEEFRGETLIFGGRRRIVVKKVVILQRFTEKEGVEGGCGACLPTVNGFKLTNRHIIMEYLPKDPFMLVSSINMLLRDEEFESLESLCDNYSRDPEEVKAYLLEHGYVYSDEQKQMRPVGYND